MSIKNKSGFIKSLWGIFDDPRVIESRLFGRRTKIQNDIMVDQICKYKVDCRVVVFGVENYKMLVDMGYNCILADNSPIIWSMTTQQFRHKLEAFKIGMSLYEQIVFLDWDTLPILSIPQNFWETLQQKASMQASLRSYKRRKAEWRTINRNLLPCASFVYINDDKIPEELISIWQELNCPWSEEIVMAKWMDNYLAQLKEEFDPINYEKHFEPEYFYLSEQKPLCMVDLSYYDNKPKIFQHFGKRHMGKILRSPLKYSYIKGNNETQ